MEQDSENPRCLGPAERIYQRTGRRGFLAKSAATVVAFGLGDSVLRATKASSDPLINVFCCGPSKACSSCPGTCPSTNSCPSGWTYDGYKWTCCYNNRVVYCRDCTKGGSTCICTCLDNQLLCDSAGAAQAAMDSWTARAAH
jgi:hypothetical protein